MPFTKSVGYHCSAPRGELGKLPWGPPTFVLSSAPQKNRKGIDLKASEDPWARCNLEIVNFNLKATWRQVI